MTSLEKNLKGKRFALSIATVIVIPDDVCEKSTLEVGEEDALRRVDLNGSQAHLPRQ